MSFDLFLQEIVPVQGRRPSVLIFPMALSQPKQAIPTTPKVSGRTTAIALDVLRHALPLIPLYLWRGSITNYLFLTAFDLSLGLMLIVGTTVIEAIQPRSIRALPGWLRD